MKYDKLIIYIYIIYMCVYIPNIFIVFYIYTSSYPLYRAESKELLYLYFWCAALRPCCVGEHMGRCSLLNFHPC